MDCAKNKFRNAYTRPSPGIFTRNINIVKLCCFGLEAWRIDWEGNKNGSSDQ